MNLITPAFIQRVSRLHWPIKRRLHGIGHGMHQGRNRGAGLEFSEYRRYELGDDLRRLDWKLLARSDRYFIREAERESQVPCYLLLDTSVSMNARDTGGDWSRIALASAVAAGLAAIAIRQGDEAGLITLSNDNLRVQAARRGFHALKPLVSTLQTLRGAGQLPPPEQASVVFSVLRRPALCVLISDFFDDSSLRWLRYLYAGRQDVIALALTTRQEREFAFDKSMTLLDDDQSRLATIAPNEQRSGYLQAFQAHRQQWQHWCTSHDVQWLDADVRDTPEAIIRRLLDQRLQRPIKRSA